MNKTCRRSDGHYTENVETSLLFIFTTRGVNMLDKWFLVGKNTLDIPVMLLIHCTE